jgi:hypothetical protein
MKTFAAAVISGTVMISTGSAENLLDNASFELPVVSKATPVSEGGDPALPEGKTTWTSLLVPKPGGNGKLTAGLTNTIARTGKQSLFVDFDKFTGTGARATLSADIVPVKSDSPYRVSLWGHLDRERPLTMDERRPHILISVEYFAADQETQLGETEYRSQIIPGNNIPGVGVRLLFSSSKWAEYYTDLKSPVDAAFMKLVIMVEAPRVSGETDGVIYLDDAAIEGERGSTPVDLGETADDAPPKEPAPAAPAPTEK